MSTMKVNMKALVAAVALCATGGANAAIDLGPGSLGNNMELFFSVWDPVKQVSVTRDLGIHFEDFLSTEQFQSRQWLASDNTVFSSTFAQSNPNDLRWNVAGANEFNSNGTNLSTYGFMTTTQEPISQIQTALVNDPATAVGAAIIMSKGYAQTVNGSDMDAAVNNTTSATVNDGGAYAGSGKWNNTFGGVFGGIKNDAAVGESMAFYQIAMNGEFTQAIVNPLAGTFQLAANGDLTYDVAVAPVPLPPAVWLLGSALIGLAGIARRKRKEAGDDMLLA